MRDLRDQVQGSLGVGPAPPPVIHACLTPCVSGNMWQQIAACEMIDFLKQYGKE